MTDYLFNGYYGYRNIGDDVFCVVADWGSKKYWGAEHSAFMAPELPKLSAPAQCVIPTQKKYPGHETIARSWATLAAKNIVYFGGSTLHSPQENWMTLARHPFVRSISGKRIAAVGVSVGPFRSQESLAAVKTFLSEMSFISVRDQASYAILQDMNIDVPMVRAFDPAVLLLDVIADEMIDATKGQPVTELTRSRKILGVSVCCAERYVGGDLDVEKKRISTITAALKKLKKSDVLFRFFEFNGHAQSGDAAVTDEVIAALDGYPHVERISYSSDPRTIFQVLRECDALLGVRLHATILAYTAGVPFLLVEYHRKCSDFLDEIQFSSDDRIGDASVSEQQIVATIEAMLFDPNRRTSWQVDLNVARELAMKNFTEAPFLV